mmetsp:Transcript_125/g.458  ORF Transcript_125/g.458 Transcript_125/m.458 type:complete len:296 (-) Transcript_125:984-1871(-)
MDPRVGGKACSERLARSASACCSSSGALVAGTHARASGLTAPTAAMAIRVTRASTATATQPHHCCSCCAPRAWTFCVRRASRPARARAPKRTPNISLMPLHAPHARHGSSQSVPSKPRASLQWSSTATLQWRRTYCARGPRLPRCSAQPQVPPMMSHCSTSHRACSRRSPCRGARSARSWRETQAGRRRVRLAHFPRPTPCLARAPSRLCLAWRKRSHGRRRCARVSGKACARRRLHWPCAGTKAARCWRRSPRRSLLTYGRFWKMPWPPEGQEQLLWPHSQRAQRHVPARRRRR